MIGRGEYIVIKRMTAEGFRLVKMSQKTRGIKKTLNRVLYGALKAMLVNIPSYRLHNQ